MAEVVPEISDAWLIDEIRRGDMDAAAELFERHRASATRFATGLAGRSDAEDLVSEAFTRTLAQLREGKGPDTAFRPYLLTAVRNTWTSRARKDARVTWLEEYTEREQTPVNAAPLEEMEQVISLDVLQQAFATLPDRWRVVLWHTVVEGESPATVARHLGSSAAAVSALAYRARRGLAQGYLEALVDSAVAKDCQTVRPLLPDYERGDLAEADRLRVQEHLRGCDDCSDARRQVGALLGRGLGIAVAVALLGSAGGVVHAMSGAVAVPAVAASSAGTPSSPPAATPAPVAAEGSHRSAALWASVGVAAAVALVVLVVLVATAVRGGDSEVARDGAVPGAPSGTSSSQPSPVETATENPRPSTAPSAPDEERGGEQAPSAPAPEEGAEPSATPVEPVVPSPSEPDTRPQDEAPERPDPTRPAPRPAEPTVAPEPAPAPTVSARPTPSPAPTVTIRPTPTPAPTVTIRPTPTVTIRPQPTATPTVTIRATPGPAAGRSPGAADPGTP